MIRCFCKTLFSTRPVGIATTSVGSKGLNFLRKTLFLVPASNRCYISTDSDNQQSFTVSYLINSFGLSLKSALSDSKAAHFETPENPDSVISFLKNYGFSEPQIIKFIKRRPRLLLYDVEKNLCPKFEFFCSKGFTRSKLATTVSMAPYILERSLERCIIPKFDLLKNLTRGEDKKVLSALIRCGSVLNRHKFLSSNLRVLQEYGVRESYIMSALIWQPITFFVKHDTFKGAVEEVKKMGFDPLKFTFIDAVLIFTRRHTSLWEKKIRLYKKWGWSDEEIWSAIRKSPRIMVMSDGNINGTLDFYINKMGYKSQYLASNPILLLLSSEKRIIPWCSVILYLISKGLIKEDYNVRSMLKCDEKRFLQKFLTPYKDPELLKLYEEKLCNSVSSTI